MAAPGHGRNRGVVRSVSQRPARQLQSATAIGALLLAGPALRTDGSTSRSESQSLAAIAASWTIETLVPGWLSAR